MDWNPTRKAMSIHSNPWANVGSSFFHQRGWSKAGFVSKYGIFHGIFLGTTNLMLNIKLVSHYFLIIFPSFPTVFHHFPIIVPSRSHHFPVIFPSFSYRFPPFPIIVPSFSHRFPIIFHFPIIIPPLFHHFPIIVPLKWPDNTQVRRC